MKKIIITIAREFGSGGRELGKRLADLLGIAYYDREILVEIEKKTPYCMEYIEQISEDTPAIVPAIHYGSTFSFFTAPEYDQSINVNIAQNDIIKEMAEKSSCVIIGRAADYVLKGMHPFRIFVYADEESKIRRCKERDTQNLSEKQIAKNIKAINKKRARFYDFYTGSTWGAKENYDLMINTTDCDIKKIAETISRMFKED